MSLCYSTLEDAHHISLLCEFMYRVTQKGTHVPRPPRVQILTCVVSDTYNYPDPNIKAKYLDNQRKKAPVLKRRLGHRVPFFGGVTR